jgi:hypothetical protein
MISGLRKNIKDQTGLELLACVAKVKRELTDGYTALQAIPGVEKITEGYNPATWMLEVSSPLTEARLEVNFAEIYANSDFYR